MSKHTPGPWFITGSMTRYVEARIGGGMLQEVAACGPTEADGGYGEQQRANAMLIAAAPDLLDALIDVRRALELANFTGELAVVDAAIAKAKGDQP